MRLSIVLALTLMVVVASVAEAKPKAKPLSVKVGLKVNSDGSSKVVPPTGEGREGDLVDVAVAAGQFTTLVKVVTDLGLVDTIKGAEALTIFAPNDAAFAEEDLSSLTQEQKKAVVLRHVVVGKVMAADVVTGKVKTFGGEEIDLFVDRWVQIKYMGGSSNVIKADVQACNAVIHVIDSVILPKPGKVVPPAGEGCEGELVDVAVAAGQFKNLVKAVTDLGLVDTIKGAEALTIFAPNDAAFAKVDPDLLASLTPEQKKEIVLRHVVVGKVMAADVVTGPVKTFGGEEIDLVAKDGGVQISYMGSSSNVIKADVQACNGVIHVIDSVILPAPVILPS